MTECYWQILIFEKASLHALFMVNTLVSLTCGGFTVASINFLFTLTLSLT